MKATTKLLIVSLAVLLAIGGYLVYANSQDQPAPKETETTTDGGTLANGESTPDAPQSEGDVNGEEESDETANISVTITTLDQTSSEVNVRTVVEGTTSGTCTVTFSKSGQSDVTREAKLALVTSYYTCQGWDIAKSAFPATGTWQAVVKIKSGDRAGSSDAQTININ